MNIFMEGENDEALHFKDEDLVTLKAQLEEMIDTTKGPIPVINIGARSLDALLARLKAAENFVQRIESIQWASPLTLDLKLLLEAWHTACGKAAGK